MSVEVSTSNIYVSADAAAVDDSRLLEAMVKDSEGALQLLQTNAPSLSLDEISISNNGVVIISNEEFKAWAKNIVDNPVGAVGQGVCGAGCASPN